jgi:hypothetical protein
MGCPTSLGNVAGIGIDHLGLDLANGWLYVHDTGVGIKRFTYPGLVLDSTIVSDTSVAGLTCDSAGNLYYILNDGAGGNTEVYKRTPGGSTSTLAGFGTISGFGLEWNPVDGMLYASMQRFDGMGGGSTLTQIDPSSGASSEFDHWTSGFPSAAGPAQSVPDGSLWYYDPNNTVTRVDSAGGRLTATAFGLFGNLTAIPTPSSTAVFYNAGGVEFGPSTPATSGAWGCSLSSAVLGAAHTADWSTVVYTDGGTIFEIQNTVGAPGRWRIGRVGW